MRKTLCCVSKLEQSSLPFLRKMSNWSKEHEWEFLLAVDGSDIQMEQGYDFTPSVFQVKSQGYVESVLDHVMSKCSGDYIFRLDDDEFFSPELSEWLVKTDLKKHQVYSFPRRNLWLDENHFIPGLYPDTQIRLTTKRKSLGRNVIHNLSPHGFGLTVDKPMYHYKFIVKDYKERKSIAETYERVKKGAGLGEYLKYNLPEDYYKEKGISSFHVPIKN